MADYFEEMGWTPLEEGESPNYLLHFARLLRDFGMFEVLGEDKKLPPPASKEVVNNLKKVKIEKPDIKCTICLKEYDVGEFATMLPCNHGFHSECISPWLNKVNVVIDDCLDEQTNSCPLCRHEMPTDDKDYECYRKEKLRSKERENDLKNLHNSMFL